MKATAAGLKVHPLVNQSKELTDESTFFFLPPLITYLSITDVISVGDRS